MLQTPEAAEQRLVRELEAYADDLEALSEAEYVDPAAFADAFVNNLPAIRYALGAGMPVTAWRPATKNSSEVERVLRAVRLWEEAARRLLVMLAAGHLTAEQFRDALIAAYRRQARNSYLAGRRAMGDLSPLTDAEEEDIDDLTGDDEDSMAAWLTSPVAVGGIGSLLASMILDPTNYLGSGLPGDPWKEWPAPLGAGYKPPEKMAAQALKDAAKGKVVKPETIMKAVKAQSELQRAGRAVPESVAKVAAMLQGPASLEMDAAREMAEYQKRVQRYGDSIRSLSHRGEMSALTNAIPGDATLVWWTLGATDHCIDCVRLSDASPFYASTLEGNGIAPGSGHTRCGGRCRCGLQYDVPAEVCTDPFSGPGSLGDLTESADGRRVNVWVQEAATCRNPVSVDALAQSLDMPGSLDDDAAFAWDDDLAAAITGDLESSVTMQDIEAVAAGTASREVRRAVARIVDGKADGFARQADYLRGVVPGRPEDLRLARYTVDGSVYHVWWSETGNAIRFELGATTSGLPVLDSDLTLRALSDLAARADQKAVRLEVNALTASDGMKRWLEALGASTAQYGGIPPSVLPAFRQQADIAARNSQPLAGIAPGPTAKPGLAEALTRTAEQVPHELNPPALERHLGFISRQGRPDVKLVDGKVVETPKSADIRDRYAMPETGPSSGYRSFPPSRGESSTFVVAYDADGNAVASMSIDRKAQEVGGVAVRSDAGRQGWATRLYDHIQDETDINLYPAVGKEMTREGKAFVTRWLAHRADLEGATAAPSELADFRARVRAALAARNKPTAGIAPGPVGSTAEEQGLLDSIGRFERNSGKPVSPENQYLLDHGRFFETSPIAPPQGRGKPQFCTYNVGKAIAAGLPDGWSVAFGKWASGSGHTWLVDDLGRAVDPTPPRVKGPMPRFGVTLSPDDAKRYLLAQDAENALETGSSWNFPFHAALKDLAAKAPPSPGIPPFERGIPDLTIRTGTLPEVNALPALPDAALLKPAGPDAMREFGGTQAKGLFRDPAGQEWLGRSEGVDADVGASALANALGLRVPPTTRATVDGVEYSLQPIIRADSLGERFLNDPTVTNLTPFETLTPEQASEVARQSVLNFLIANEDAHAGNLLLDPEGRLWGIDFNRGFAGAVATSPKPDTFYRQVQEGAGTSRAVFHDAVQNTRSGLLLKTSPGDYATVIGRVDAMTDAEYLRIVGAQAVDRVMSPLATHAQRADALLIRKDNLQAGYERLFRDLVDATDPNLVSPEWKAWRQDGGSFYLDDVVVPGGSPEYAAKMMPEAQPLPAFYAAKAGAPSLVGNDLGVWSKDFIPASTRDEASKRLEAILTGTKANVLDGFTLGQLNSILDRVEVMRDAGIDMTLLRRLGDFSKVPKADKGLGIGLTYSDRIALNHEHQWGYLAGIDSPDTVYNDVGGLFAHEYGHVLANTLPVDERARAFALWEEWGEDASGLSTYAGHDAEEWFGEVVAAITTPGYRAGTLPFDGEVWSILASGGKATAQGADSLPVVAVKAPSYAKVPEVRHSIRTGAYGDVTEMVPVASLLRYGEFDRAAAPLMSDADFAKLRADIKKNGIQSPLQLEYSVQDGTALLTEGNHRLAIARDLGIEWVPVRGVRRNGSFGAEQAAKAQAVPDAVKPDAFGYVKGDLKPRDILSAPELELPAPPTEPVGPPVPAPKKTWLKPADPQEYLLPGNPLPLNAPQAEWTGYVPPEPPPPTALLKASPQDLAAARKASDEAYIVWQDVITGDATVAITWGKKETDEAVQAGLHAEKIGDHWVVARGEHDLDALRVFIEDGGDSDSDAFWRLAGYSDQRLDAIDRYAQMQGGLRYTGGVLMVEPDGRLWLLAPRNEFAGYQNTHIKGGVDAGESAGAAAVREMREEAGFSVELDAYVGDYVNSDRTGLTRFYIGHRTGGGPLWAHQKETYEVRLVTPDEAKGMLTRYGKPDPRDQTVLDDAMTMLQGGEPKAQYVIPDGAVAELAAKTTIPTEPSVWWPPEKSYGVKAQPGIAPDPPVSTAFGFDHAAMKQYQPGNVTPPGSHFPMFQSKMSLPDGTKQPFYWKTQPLPQATNPDAQVLFWANSKKQVDNPHLRYVLHVRHLLVLAEQMAADPNLIRMEVNDALLQQVPKLRELLIAAGGSPVGKLVSIDRSDLLALAHAVESNTSLPAAKAAIPTASLTPEPKQVGKSGTNPEQVHEWLAGGHYDTPVVDFTDYNEVAWTSASGATKDTSWTLEGATLLTWPLSNTPAGKEEWQEFLAANLMHVAHVAHEAGATNVRLSSGWFGGVPAEKALQMPWLDEMGLAAMGNGGMAGSWVLPLSVVDEFVALVNHDIGSAGLPDFAWVTDPVLTGATAAPLAPVGHIDPTMLNSVVQIGDSLVIDGWKYSPVIKTSGFAGTLTWSVSTFEKATASQRLTAETATLKRLADEMNLGTYMTADLSIKSGVLSDEMVDWLSMDYGLGMKDGALLLSSDQLKAFGAMVAHDAPAPKTTFVGELVDYFDLQGIDGLAKTATLKGDASATVVEMADGWTAGSLTIPQNGALEWAYTTPGGYGVTTQDEGEVALLRNMLEMAMSNGAPRLIIAPKLTAELRWWLMSQGATEQAYKLVIEAADMQTIAKGLAPSGSGSLKAVVPPPAPMGVGQASDALSHLAGMTEAKVTHNGLPMTMTTLGNAAVTWRRLGNVLEVHYLESVTGNALSSGEFDALIMRMAQVVDASPKVSALRFTPATTTDIMNVTLTPEQMGLMSTFGGGEYAGGFKMAASQLQNLRNDIVAASKSATATPGQGEVLPLHTVLTGEPYDPAVVAKAADFDGVTVLYTTELDAEYGVAAMNAALHPDASSPLAYKASNHPTGAAFMWHMGSDATDIFDTPVIFDTMMPNPGTTPLQDFLSVLAATIADEDVTFIVTKPLLAQLPELKPLLRPFAITDTGIHPEGYLVTGRARDQLKAKLSGGELLKPGHKAAKAAPIGPIPTPLHDALVVHPKLTADLQQTITPMPQGFEKVTYTSALGADVAIRQRVMKTAISVTSITGKGTTSGALRHIVQMGERIDGDALLTSVRYEAAVLDKMPQAWRDMLMDAGGYMEKDRIVLPRSAFLNLRDSVVVEMGMGPAHAALTPPVQAAGPQTFVESIGLPQNLVKNVQDSGYTQPGVGLLWGNGITTHVNYDGTAFHLTHTVDAFTSQTAVAAVLAHLSVLADGGYPVTLDPGVFRGATGLKLLEALKAAGATVVGGNSVELAWKQAEAVAKAVKDALPLPWLGDAPSPIYAATPTVPGGAATLHGQLGLPYSIPPTFTKASDPWDTLDNGGHLFEGGSATEPWPFLQSSISQMGTEIIISVANNVTGEKLTKGMLTGITDAHVKMPQMTIAVKAVDVPSFSPLEQALKAAGATSANLDGDAVWLLSSTDAGGLADAWLNNTPLGTVVSGSAAVPPPAPAFGQLDDPTFMQGEATLLPSGNLYVRTYDGGAVYYDVDPSPTGPPGVVVHKFSETQAGKVDYLVDMAQWAESQNRPIWWATTQIPSGPAGDALKKWGAVNEYQGVEGYLVGSGWVEGMLNDLDPSLGKHMEPPYGFTANAAPTPTPTSAVPQQPVANPSGVVGAAPSATSTMPGQYGFDKAELLGLGPPVETQMAQGFSQYEWSFSQVKVKVKVRSSSTTLTLASVSGKGPKSEVLVDTIRTFGARMDAKPGIMGARFRASALEPGVEQMLKDFGATHPVGDYLLIGRDDLLKLRKALDDDLTGAFVPGTPAGAVPFGPTIPAAPKAPDLGDVYHYNHAAAVDLSTTPTVHTMTSTLLTAAHTEVWPDGTTLKWAEEMQGKARILRIRSVTGPQASEALMAFLITPAQSKSVFAKFAMTAPERTLVDKKALTPQVEQLLKDAQPSTEWKETKDYWSIRHRYFDGNVGAYLDPATDFADAVLDGYPVWLPNVQPGGAFAAAPAPAGIPVTQGPLPTFTTAAGDIGGAKVAPKTVEPSFIYGYDTAQVAAIHPTEVDRIGSGKTERIVLGANGVKAQYSVSETGARVGLWKLERPAGMDQHDVANVAYAMLRDITAITTTKGVFVKPEFYDAVPGLRQLIIDVGGSEANWSNVGTAVQMTPEQAKVLVSILTSNSMQGITPGFGTSSGYLGFDGTTAKAMFGSQPKSKTKTTATWTVGNETATVEASLKPNGEATLTGVSGTTVTSPLAVAAQLNWLAEQGALRIDVSKAVVEAVPGLRTWLLSVGGKVQGGIVRLDEEAVGDMRRHLTKDALPVALGGKPLPYSVVDVMNANVDSTVEAIGKHTVHTGGLTTESTFVVGSGRVSTTYARSATNIHWTRVDATASTVGEGRAATTAQLRAFANDIAQHANIQRLDVAESVLAQYPGLANVLKRYKATRVAAANGDEAYLSMARADVLRLRTDLEAEFLQLGAATGAQNVVEQWAGVVKWPTVEDLKPASTRGMKGQTKKALFVDANGDQWLFKPGSSGRGAVTDAAVAELAKLLGLPVPPVRLYSLEVDGKVVEGSLQKMLPGAQGMKDVTALTPTQTEEMLRHSALDWLVNNDDAHIDNWLITPEGRLWSIDKTRAWTTWGTNHDVLDNASYGNAAANGTKPQMFAFWTAVQADPNLLAKIHPSALNQMLRTLQNMPDAEFERIVRPVAAMTQIAKFKGNPDAFVAEMLARKRSAATDLAAYFKRNIDDAVRKTPAAVPAEWKVWAKEGGIFNLNATPEDLWREDLAAMNAEFGIFTASRYTDVLNKEHMPEMKAVASQYIGSGLRGAKAGSDLYPGYIAGAKGMKVTPEMAARIRGVAPEGNYAPNYIPLLPPQAQYERWLRIQQWAMLSIANGAAGPRGHSFDNALRAAWDPTTGTFVVGRGSGRFNTPKAAYDDLVKSGSKDAKSYATLGREWGGIKTFARLRYTQFITSVATDITRDEAEWIARDIRPENIITMTNGVTMSLSQLLAYEKSGKPPV